MLSDLQEDYDEKVHREGTEAARRWYRGQVRGSILPLLSQRFSRRRGTDARRRVSFSWRPSVAVSINAFNRGSTIMDVFRDLRVAARSLAKKPKAMAVTVLSLALGIGVVTVAFSVADALVFRSLTGGGPEDLVAVYQGQDDGEPYGRFSFPDYLEVED
ncbi:MAG: hypothetical protein MI919_13930, partial [Holophagales bacterium]|nr:hypothetical protein [Holophagales bacterium]